MIEARILADSINPAKCRLTTLHLRYPRFIHSQMMTHRLFSRNTASSRAVPAAAFRDAMLTDAAIPVYWGKNQKGMVAGEELDEDKCLEWWGQTFNLVYHQHKLGEEMGLHKEVLNRILEPWAMLDAIFSSTEWDNFFHQRIHGQQDNAAQHEIDHLACAVKKAMDNSEPQELKAGQWHLPLVELTDRKSPLYVPNAWREGYNLPLISAGRCGRVSYKRIGAGSTVEDDLQRGDKFSKDKHWSPLEHTAMAMQTDSRWGNFFGYKQLRKFYPGEHHGRDLE